MKKGKISIFLVFMLILLASNVFAAQINSTSYKQNVIVSVGGENLSSSSYKLGVAIGIIAKVINSTSYINRLGFFHTWLLANDQPCTSASQCEGGFCCSNLCKSSACPSPSEGPSGGGGAGEAAAGGGGGGSLVNFTAITEKPQIPKDFIVRPSSIKEKVKLGASKIQKVKIANTGNEPLSFDLNVLTVDNFVFLSDSSFNLKPGEEKDVEMSITGRRLGSYFGELEITADGIRKSINVVIDVESEQVLFDVKLDILPDYKEVVAGNDLKAQITLLSIGPARKVDVIATYIIKDKRGNVIDESTETFAVEKQASFVKSFSIPKTLRLDDYLAIIEVRYENSFAVSSELFRIIKKEALIKKAVKSNIILMFMLIVFVMLLILSLYLLVSKVKRSKRNKSKKS